MIIKRIHSQDAHYKFSPKKSGETSLNLSNDIFQLIAPELSKGEEKPVSFTLFRSDYLKALGIIINYSPLYVTSSTTATEVTSDPNVFIKDFQSICTFFGSNERNTYTVNLLYRLDGRIYLNSLEDKNSKFNLRHFLVEETSSLVFEKDGNDISIRLKFDILDKNDTIIGADHPKVGDIITHEMLPYLTALRTKPFMLLAGISGTGKSRIVRELAFKSCPKYLQDKDGTTPGNYCMIEVKPNWHDSTELIGYYSNLSQSYQFKKFVKFLVKAQMNPDVPFFVCLDEMNLAPVEQYFAEILSILETRKHPRKDGEPDMTIIKTEVVVDSKYFRPTWKDADNAIHEKVISDANWYREFFAVEKGSAEEEQILKYQESYILRDEGLRLPDNLFIIGTVNMDDTTHQFSRKVIDRAMTIEMNGGKLANMFGGSKDLEYLPEKDQQTWQQAFRQHYVTADEVLEEHAEVAEELRKTLPARLDAINKVLKGTPFEVSYRVLNELTIMVGVMLDDKKEEGTLDNIINRAVDNILLMKILPRIEGDAEMFAISSEYKRENEIPYDNRLEWLMALAPDIMATKTAEASGEAPTSEDVNRATARGKIKEMIDRLDNQEFTRFWP